jgi:SAM-dependent methyltransferase
VLDRRIARTGRSLVFACAASGGGQNFLGRRWVESLVENSPDPLRERVALRLLSLSPHYFYGRDIHAEDERLRRSRRVLAETIVSPYLSQNSRVIDYGCGPGYLARAVAEGVEHVDAVDISRGVLACARALNGRTNVRYLTPGELRQAAPQADLAYSFAVAQHMRTRTLVAALNLLASTIRRGGILMVHFAAPGRQGWRTEAEWETDRSVASRLKLRYGLNCFGRPAAQMESLAAASGFTDVTVRSLDDIAVQSLDGAATASLDGAAVESLDGAATASLDGAAVVGDEDIFGQHLLLARRR